MPRRNAREGDGSLNEFFEALTADELPLSPFNKVVVLPSNLSVAEACRSLGKYNILAAPVRDISAPDDSTWVDKYIGVIDFLCIVDWMIQRSKGQMPESPEALAALEEAFQTTTIKELAEAGRWNPFVVIDSTIEPSVLPTMVILGKYGVSRVYLTEGNGDLTSAVTQTTAAQFLLERMDVLGSVGTRTIRELGLVNHDAFVKDVVSVHEGQTYWDAFRAMSDMLISAVPIVNDANKLTGTLSVKDIRNLFTSPLGFKMLTSPLTESEGISKRHLTCSPTDTLESALDLIIRHYVHRLWILDENEEVKGVLSLRDCIAIFVREPLSSPISPLPRRRRLVSGGEVLVDEGN